ncbi:MAG: YihY/virulence factor BrkB family protein [Nitriliruptoraceae bacterium]
MADERVPSNGSSDGRPRRGRAARTPTDIPAAGWKELLQRVVTKLKEDHVSLLAAGVAFKALLALFPALIAAVSLWGLLADPETITEQIAGLVDALPEEVAGIIEQQLTQIAGGGAGALSFTLVVSILLALWSASAGMAGLMEGCNAAYDEVDRRSFVHKRGLALVFTVVGVVFLLLTLGLIAVLPALLGTLGLGSAGQLAVRIGQWPLLALLAMGAISLIYRYAPDRAEPQLKWVTGGAGLATILWLLASAAFTVYVEVAGSFAETYGALAGVIMLMLWLYLTAFSILLGAEFNAEVERQTVVDTTAGDPQPMGQRNAHVADTHPQPPSSRGEGRA